MTRADEIRTAAQNARLHAMIRDISEQLPWAGEFRDEEYWKRLILGAAYGQDVVPNPFDESAPPVVVNKRRSRGLVVPETADLITQLQILGDDKGIKWRDEARAA